MHALNCTREVRGVPIIIALMAHLVELVLIEVGHVQVAWGTTIIHGVPVAMVWGAMRSTSGRE
jgi:hypothetical protein